MRGIARGLEKHYAMLDKGKLCRERCREKGENAAMLEKGEMEHRVEE